MDKIYKLGACVLCLKNDRKGSMFLYELDDELTSKVLVLAKKMVVALTDILGCDGYNILQNNGPVAGQTVFHFHMHLIPRYKDDDVTITWKHGQLTDELKEEILKKLSER